MQVTIIGSGKMASGITAKAIAGGHSVTVHARHPQKADNLKAQGATVVEVGSQVEGDIVILAVPYRAIKDIAKTYGNMLDEKVVVDITNPVDFESMSLIPKPGTSGAEEVAAIFPASKVVKAFNTVFSAVLQAGQAGGLPIDVFIAGDDQQAKDYVSDLAKDGGMRPIDVGPLNNARHLEGFELLHMMVQEQVTGNWSSAVKLVA